MASIKIHNKVVIAFTVVVILTSIVNIKLSLDRGLHPVKLMKIARLWQFRIAQRVQKFQSKQIGYTL